VPSDDQLPHAAVEEPANGSTVVLTGIVSGRSTGVPSGGELWALVTRPGPAQPYHPQGPLNMGPDGRFNGTAHFGLPTSIGTFELELVLVGAAGAHQFREYLSHATARGTYPGVPSLPPDAQILDHVEVSRG
jgi:hypothetical protein